MSFPVTLFALPHALMTNASLYAMTITASIPAALSLSLCSMKPGRWRAEQPGVKAPVRYGERG